GRGDERAGSLTLAEQRRLEVARALAAEPVLLLLDEPAAGLDPSEVAALVALVRAVRDAGVSVVLVEHRMEAALALADVVTVLHQGVVLVEGPPAEVAGDRRVVEAYLGPGEGS
ncbi:MAG: hypothetical protein M3Q48_06480, partial [Actinomycetota bacterium]|nr:hypothetical protein [Actinomycetota bacterium]